jgi:hypothetical protein
MVRPSLHLNPRFRFIIPSVPAPLSISIPKRAPARPTNLPNSKRFIEEPTAPDDALGHAAIREALKPIGVGVATGEHAHNRVMFKQLFQAGAVDVVQPDACRLAGVSEVLAVLLLAAKFGVLACFHAGGVGLCEHTIHLRYVIMLILGLGRQVSVEGSCQSPSWEWGSVDHHARTRRR